MSIYIEDSKSLEIFIKLGDFEKFLDFHLEYQEVYSMSF